MLKGFLINMNIFFLLFILACPPLMVLITSYGFTRDPVNWRKWLPLFVLIFFLIAYSYNPQSIPDLTRYFQMLQDIQGLSFSNVNLYFNDSLYLKNFISKREKMDIPSLDQEQLEVLVQNIIGAIIKQEKK